MSSVEEMCWSISTKMLKFKFFKMLDFSNVKVRECILPRTEIIAVGLNSSIDNLLKILLIQNFRKYLFTDKILTIL